MITIEHKTETNNVQLENAVSIYTKISNTVVFESSKPQEHCCHKRISQLFL